jgi:competence protein ComGF
MFFNVQSLAVSNQEAMNHFIVIIIALAVVIIAVLILGSKNSRFRKFIVWMFEEDQTNVHKNYLNGQKKNARSPRTEIVMLVQKTDERKRVVDARGYSRLFNEYYELVFRTRKGEAIHIITDKNIYRQIPFNQQGSLTFLHDEFIKFKTVSEVIEKPKATSKS